MNAVTKKVGFRLAALLLGVVTIVVGLELVANVYLYARDRRYVPAAARLDTLTNTFTSELTKQNAGCRYVDTLYPHPYLGFVHHGNPPCGQPGINASGCLGRTSRPSGPAIGRRAGDRRIGFAVDELGAERRSVLAGHP